MRFFKKKDKRRKDGNNDGYGSMPGGGGGLPGFGNSDFRSGGESYGGAPPQLFGSRPTRRSAMLLARFEAKILDRIFAFVCPQSVDESYETCEQSSIEDACMLCDLRDLARCVLVCRRWREAAVGRLYVDALFLVL